MTLISRAEQQRDDEQATTPDATACEVCGKPLDPEAPGFPWRDVILLPGVQCETCDPPRKWGLMITKTIEIRDKGTFIPALAVQGERVFVVATCKRCGVRLASGDGRYTSCGCGHAG